MGVIEPGGSFAGTTGITRKPLLRRKPTGKFKRQPFQEQDIAYLNEIPAGSANWSEMGTMKTSTTEWFAETKFAHIPNPRILIITTKTGKGPYLESLWETLPAWDVYNIDTNRISMVLGGRVIKRKGWSVKFPTPLHLRPVIALAHYNCFTNRACQPQIVQKMVTLPNGKEVKRPVLNEDGTVKMEIPGANWLMHAHWDMIICDEAHRLKNYDSQWTRNIKKIKCGYKHLMTGTGFVNNPAEIWSLLDWLYSSSPSSPHASIVGSRGYWPFREYFCDEDDYAGYRKITGIKAKKVEEFQRLVRSIGVRRTMLECFPDIQEPIETVIPVDLSPTQRKMYNEIVEFLHTLDMQGVPLHSPTVLSMLNRCRQIAVATPEVTGDKWNEELQRREITVKLTEPSSKLDAAMEVIDGLEWDIERKDQVVVFSNYRQPLELLATRLTNKNIPFLHLRSEMNDGKRYELWHDEWPQQKHQVFLTTLDLGAESINLTSAHRAIFLDQHWSPAKNKQAIGRIYRPGQTGAAQMIYIRANGTVDFRVLETVNEKMGWFKQIFGAQGDDDDTED